MTACKFPFLVASLCLFAVSPLAAQADANAPALPRYRFEVGQKIVFEGKGTSEASYGTTKRTITWTIWVTDRTSTGSYRLVLKRTTKQSRTLRNGEERESARDSHGWVDMYPDGRFAPNRSIALGLDPSTILVPLPRSEGELADGWQRKMPIFDRVYTCKIVDGDGEGMHIDVAVDSPSHRNYLRKEKLSFTFDKGKGFPVAGSATSEATWRGKSESKTTLELKSIDRDESDWPRKFAREFQDYSKAKQHYDEASFSGRTQPDPAKRDELLAKALEELNAARKEIILPEVQKPLDKLIAGHPNRIKYVTSYAERFAPVIQKPSKPWAAKNLKGEKRSLVDYSGKVVVLDFWYRGCGWCVRAMPQMNELHEHYKGRPVAILGVNKDKNLEDAHFTVKAVGLKYENLHSLTMPELYGVRGYPTLVVLDQKGVVRDIHIGYSPTLKKELVKVIDGLLAKHEGE